METLRRLRSEVGWFGRKGRGGNSHSTKEERGMNRRLKPSVFALVTFCSLALVASMVVAFIAAEVYNIGAPAVTVGPNTPNVLAMDIFMADNTVLDIKLLPGERASGLGDPISYFDRTNGFSGYVNFPMDHGDQGAAFPANSTFANRGGAGADNVPTGGDHANKADEIWEDLDTDGFYDAGEPEVWFEGADAPLDGVIGIDLRTWASGAYGPFVWANDEIYFLDGGPMAANKPMWIDRGEDGPAGEYEHELIIYPEDTAHPLFGAGTFPLDGTVAVNTFALSAAREVWADGPYPADNTPGTFDYLHDHVWDDTYANNRFDNEPVKRIFGAPPASGDAGFPFGAPFWANQILFEDEDLDGLWEPGEDFFEDINGNGQWDAGEPLLPVGGPPWVGDGIILLGAPGAPVPSDWYWTDGPAGVPGVFDPADDDVFVDTNGSGNYETEVPDWLLNPVALPDQHPGTAFDDDWSFSAGYALIWDDITTGDGNGEYDADLVVFGAPPAHPNDPAPQQPDLYNGDEEIYVDNIPASIGFTGKLSITPDDPLNVGQDGVNAAHGADLTPFTYDPEGDGVERFADISLPAGYNDTQTGTGDEIFEDHDNSETYTLRADDIILGDDGDTDGPTSPAAGDPLVDPGPGVGTSFLDLDFDGYLSDDEPVFDEGAVPNVTMDVGETPMANWSGGPLTEFPDNVYIIDTNGNGTYDTGEPIFDNLNFAEAIDGDPLTYGDMLAEDGIPAEPPIRTSGPGQLISFAADEFYVDPTGAPLGYLDGDDILWTLRVGTSGTPADAQFVFSFFGPDGIPGVGGDDLLYQSFDVPGAYQPTEDNIFIDRDNNRQLDQSRYYPTAVIAGDDDIGETIVPLTNNLWHYRDIGATANTFDPFNEPNYIDVDDDNAVSAGDIRVFWHLQDEVIAGDEDDGQPGVYFASNPGVNAEIIFYDENNTGTYGVGQGDGEPAYWTNVGGGFPENPIAGTQPTLLSTEGVAPGVVVRLCEVVVSDGLGNTAVYPPLSLVHEGDWDLDPALFDPNLFEYFAAPPALNAAMYLDAGLAGFQPHSDLVYVDENQPGGPNVIDPGDDRILTYLEGSVVAVGDYDETVGGALIQDGIDDDEIAVKDGWGGTPGAYDPGEQMYIREPNGFAGYPLLGGADGMDGFLVAPGDVRTTWRNYERMIVQGPAGNPERWNDWLAPFSEEFIPNGVLDGPYDESLLNEPDFGYDLNHDGDALDTGLNIDLNASGASALNAEGEDRNLDHILNRRQYMWASSTPLASPDNTVSDAQFFWNGASTNGFFAPSHHIMLTMHDGAIVFPTPGDRMSHNWGKSKHFDDGGRGYGLPGQFWWYDGISGNTVYDDGEAIVLDTDDDDRWDTSPVENIETDSGILLLPGVAAPQPIPSPAPPGLVPSMPAVLPMNGFSSPTFVFADVYGGAANGLYEDNEAIIADADDDLRWENPEVCVLNSETGHLNAFTIEKHWNGGADDWVLDWDGGGTYSDGPDSPRDIVDGVIDTPEGFALTTFPDFIQYHNVSPGGTPADEYQDYENDEIFADLDGDGQVTIDSDAVIYAGGSAAENGDDLLRFLPVGPWTAADNQLVGWVDDDASTTYDGDAGDEEDIYFDADGDGVVDELDDVMTDFALYNPLSANEPTDVVAVNLWMEDGTTAGFQPTEDMLIGQGTVDPMDSRSWTWTDLDLVPVPILSEDRNQDGDDDDTLDETTDYIDYNGDGDLLDNAVVEQLLVNGVEVDAGEYAGGLWGRDDLDSQLRMYVTIDISADPQNLLIGNQFDATIPINGINTLALNMGPTDVEIANSLTGGPVTIDDYPPTVTRVEEIWLNDYAPGAINVIQPGDNEYEVGGNIDLTFRTPSDHDVRRLRVQYALDEAGPWFDLDQDPNADIGSDGEPGLAGVDDDGDWNINTDDVGADGLPNTGDAGEGNGIPDAGEPGVDRMDPEVLAALTNPLTDGLDNNDDGYVDDFEFEPPGMDIDRDGLVGEGFPEPIALQNNGIDDDGDGVIDDDGVDVNGNGIFGEPDPDVDPVTLAGGDSDYLPTHASLYMYDNDENGIADRDETMYLTTLANDNFWIIPDSLSLPPNAPPKTMWQLTLDTKLLQYVFNESATLPEYDRIYVKGVAYDMFGNVMPLYAAPTVLWFDNMAPEVVVSMTDSEGNPVNDGDIVYDNETYSVGATSTDSELLNISLDYAKNDEATFANNLGVIQELDETLDWTPDPVGNTPPDQTDDYYWEATASDILGWYSVTSQQWQPYTFGVAPNNYFGNVESSALPTCNPGIVLNCLMPPDVAELHVEAENATAPMSAITRMYTETRMGYDPTTSPYWFPSLGDFADGVRVPAYNAVLIFVDNEDLNEDGILNDGVPGPGHGPVLDEAADNFDYNRDGDKLDLVNEDMNGNGLLDDGIDDGDGNFRTSDIVGCVFEQTLAGESNWVPIETVTGDTVGGVVQDLSFPVAVSWDTRDLAASEVTYYVRVRCWDVEGNWIESGIEIVTATVDATGLNAYFNQDPLEVTDPSIDGAVVNGTIDLYAYSCDPRVTQVLFRFSDDGGITWYEIGTDTNPDAGGPAPTNPTIYRDWHMSFDTSHHPDGDYMFDVVGLDEFGNSDEDPTDPGQVMTLTFDNTAPILAISSPAAGTFVSAANGNQVLSLVADAQTVENGPVSAQFQYSTDGGATWNDIDGINSEAGTATLRPGDYFADNPRKGLRMGAFNMHPTGFTPLPDWLQDMVYRKSVNNTDMSMVEAGDYRVTGCPWTDPMYAADTWVGKDDQDVGTPLTPLLAPYDPADDTGNPSADTFGPYTATFVTNAVLAHQLGDEMKTDTVVLLRCVGTDAFGTSDPSLAPSIEVTIRDNADPITDVIEVKDPSGGWVVDSQFSDPYIVPDQFPGGITFEDNILVQCRVIDNDVTVTDQQGTIQSVQLWYRPRMVDYNYTGVINWLPGPTDNTYPFIFDMDISGMNGLYEFTVQATDESGNTSGPYPQFSLVVQNQEATVTGLPATINEGATVTLNADHTAPPIDGDLPLTANFWVAPVVLGEMPVPEFQNSGTYAGYYTATLEEDVVNDVDPLGYPIPSGAANFVTLDGRDVVVDVGGTPGVYHPFGDLMALAAPTPYDFAIDYATDEVIFAVNPATAGDVTIDYHSGGWTQVGIGDDSAPFSVEWTPGFSMAGDYDVICQLVGTTGAASPSSGAFARPIVLSSDPGDNVEPPFAEWNVLTVADAQAPLFTVGGLGRLSTDDPAFVTRWIPNAMNLGNAVNNMDGGPETMLSGNEVDLLVQETGEVLDPTSVTWAIRDGGGVIVDSGSFTDVGGFFGIPRAHPITFTLFESDFAQVVQGSDFENVELWLDFNSDNDYNTDMAERNAEVFAMTDMGDYWQTVVTFDSSVLPEYMFLVDTIGDDLDFNGDGVEDPVDDPRNQVPPDLYGDGYEIDQNNGGVPLDSYLIMPDYVSYWANADISGLPDGVYFFDITGADMAGNESTFSKRVVLDRTPFPQDHIAVTTADEVYEAMPGATVTLFAHVTDPLTGDVNVNDALQVTFQYFDGVDWLWCNGGSMNTSANAIDNGPADGWSIDWTVPDPSSDLKDNDGDGYVDELDEGQFTAQVRAVVRDLAFNLAYGSPATDFTIDGIAPLTHVALAEVEGDAGMPTPAEGKVITLGEWVDLYAPVPSNEAAEAVVFQYSMNANAGSSPAMADAARIWPGKEITRPAGLQKGDEISYVGDPVLTNMGGPDAFGYTWFDSKGGGAVYDWVEIEGIGTLASPGSWSDDSTNGPYPIGFTFPFYGTDCIQFWVCSNGWMTFDSGAGGSSEYDNVCLPDVDAPESGYTGTMIAPFWDDQNPGNHPVDSNRVWYHNDGSRLIVQWEEMPDYSDPYDPYTYQVILYPDGRIVMQYQTLSPGAVHASTVGVQDMTGTMGMNMTCNAPYLQDGLAIQINPPGSAMWVDIDATPLDPDDDYMTGAGVMHETPDFVADDNVGGTDYYKVRFDSEVMRAIMMGSGDLFAEVRALGVDAVGNEGTTGSTILVVNDTEGPVVAITMFNVPGIGWRYANDPTLAIGGNNVTVRTNAIGFNYGDVATVTLQVSMTGGDDPADWTNVGTSTVDAQGVADFAMDVSSYADGMIYLRAYAADKDGNITGDEDGDGVIDSDEAANLNVASVMVSNGMPTMALQIFGAHGHTIPTLEDGDIIMPTLLPAETQFQPVLPQNIAVAAWDVDDGTPDVFSCDLQFFDDVTDPTAPAWLNVGEMAYRDTPGDFGPAGAPNDGLWLLQFADMAALRTAMEAAAGGQLGSREYRFRALVTSYSGMMNHSEEGIMLMYDPWAPDVADIAVGDEDLEGGGGGMTPNMPAQVAGGDMLTIQGYVPDSWDDLIPGASGPVDPGNAWESSGMYGVRARVRQVGQGYTGPWETVGLMTLDGDANLPATYVIDWETPFNVAWGDTMYDIEIAGRDMAGNYYARVRDDAVVVQDATPPSGTEITSIWAVPGAGSVFPNPVTETTIREEGTWVSGSVVLSAQTAAGDASIDTSATVFFEVSPDGGENWILLNGDSAPDSVSAGATIQMAADDAGGAHMGLYWSLTWNTLAVDGSGDLITPDGEYQARAWCIDVHGNHELLDGVAEIAVTVDNTAPVAVMDADPYTEGVQTSMEVERNDVFTAFARTVMSDLVTEDTSDDATVEFMIKLATDMNVPASWSHLGPGYDATDVNPDSTRPYSFDWWTNRNVPPLAVGADYHLATCAWDMLGNTNTEVVHHDAGVGLTITIVDTQAPVATITKLVRSMGDPTVITFPDEVCIVGIDSLEATILRGDTDTKFVRFYYRPEGTTEWILADGDVMQAGDLTWVLYNWDSSGLPEGRYEFAAVAEDDAGNSAVGPVITLIVNRTGPVFAAVSPESDAIPVWEPSLSAPTATYITPGTPIVISPEGPQPRANGMITPTGSYNGSDFRTYTITICSNGNTGVATFNWSATGQGGQGTGLLTGATVPLENGIMVEFCDGTTTPAFQTGDVFTFHTAGKTVDLIVTTDVGMDDIDMSRVFFEYKRSDLPDIDANWQRAAIAGCGVLHDDMMNTWSSKWDISGLESCLYDVRLTMWDVCGNWTTDMVAENVIVDNECPYVAITNIENADENDTTLEPIDFGQITDVTRGVPVEIWATGTDDEPCLPASHETGITQFQFQLGTTAMGGGMADIVWVIDGSGSMGPYQTAIAQNANTFATALAGLDVQYGVTWFAGSSGPINTDGSDGTALAGTGQWTTTPATFGTMVQAVGTGRSGNEEGLDALVETLQHYTFRPGARLFLVLVGDEPVQGMNLAAALPTLQGAGATVYSVISPGVTPIADYQNVALQTGGQWYDITGNWGANLTAIGGQIAAVTGGGWQDLGLYEVPEGAGDEPDVTGSTLWDTSGLTEGEYFLRVQAYDEANNVCYSGIVMVNIVDKTPPLAVVAGFDPDVLHGDDESTLERVYAMAYSDDEITDVQLQYWLPDEGRWVTFGVAEQVSGGSYDPLFINSVPEIWAADFNLSDMVELTGFSVGSEITLRAVAKDSDSNRIDNYRSDRNSPELTATIVTNPVDGSLMLCPAGTPDVLTSMAMSSPRTDNVLLEVGTAAVSDVPKALVVYEDMTGADNAAIVPMSRKVEVPTSDFAGNVDLSSVMPGGQAAIFAVAIDPDGTPEIEMMSRMLIVHPVDDALGSNGVAGIPRTWGCATYGPYAASVMVPPGNGQAGGLYIGPAGLDVPITPEAQSHYIQRYGDAYYIELFGAGDFTPGYEATVTMAYDDDMIPEGMDESMLTPRYWMDSEGGTGWAVEGISHISVNDVDDEVTFVIDNLGENNFFSLFLPTGMAPIAIQDYIPWSEGYTDHDPVIKIMLNDIYGAGVDGSTIEVHMRPEGETEWREVANTGPEPDWVLGNGSVLLRQVSADGTRWELQYNHSTLGDPHFQNEKGGDLLDGGMYDLMVKFENYDGQMFALDAAAPLAMFGVDVTPVRYMWNPDPQGLGTNFVLGRDPVIEAWIWDMESGIHIQDTWVGNQGTGQLRDGIKMDIYRVNTGDNEPGGTGDTYYSRNLIQTATPDMLVFDPPIDEYDPAVHDTLIVQYPMYQVNLDAFNGQELEVVIYTQRTTQNDPDFDESINNYDLAVMDNVGNAGSPFVEHRYRIDVCGPTVDFITPECGSVVEPDEELFVRIDLTDNCDLCDGDCNGDYIFEGSGIDLSSISMELMSPADTALTIREAQMTSERITFTMPQPLELGEHTLTVWVSDVLGNRTRAECSFMVSADTRLIADTYVYPNPLDPSNGGGSFVVNAGQEGRATIKVYDFAGDFVATVAHDVKVGWGTEIHWDGRAEDGTLLASGPYVAHVRVHNDDGAMTRVIKVMLWQFDN